MGIEYIEWADLGATCLIVALELVFFRVLIFDFFIISVPFLIINTMSIQPKQLQEEKYEVE